MNYHSGRVQVTAFGRGNQAPAAGMCDDKRLVSFSTREDRAKETFIEGASKGGNVGEPKWGQEMQELQQIMHQAQLEQRAAKQPQVD